MSDSSRTEQPGDGDERSILLGWLSFHRDALSAKCAGLTDEQLATRSAEPSALSLLGLVRHLAEMERVYGSGALGPKRPLTWVWGTYEDGAEPDIDCDASMAEESFRRWREETGKTDALLAGHPDLNVRADGNGYSVRWNLVKLMGEYARHNGHADLLAERIDGRTGE